MFRDDVERLFAELYPGRTAGQGDSLAPVDVYLTEGPPPSLTVEMNVAGADPAAIDVSLNDDLLVVRGVRRRVGQGRRVYQHAEIAWGPFERRVRLGVAVDPGAARAACENGILRITLPLAPARPSHRVVIAIQQQP